MARYRRNKQTKKCEKTSKKIIAVAVAKLALDSFSTFYTLA